MSKFKVGDHVRIITPNVGCHNPFGSIDIRSIVGKEDIIKSIDPEGAASTICIRLEKYPWRFTEDYFELVKPEIKVVYKVHDMEFEKIEDAQDHIKRLTISKFIQSKLREPIGSDLVGFLMKHSKELIEILKD